MKTRMGVTGVFNNIILWEFDILSSPRTQAIPPRDPDSQDDELDNVIHQKTGCNCFNLPTILSTDGHPYT